MPAVVAWLLGGLITVAGSIAGRVLLSLGIGWLAYTGLDTSIAWMKAQALNSLSGLGPQVVGLMATMKVGEFISILFSALTTRLLLNGLAPGGAIYKLARR